MAQCLTGLSDTVDFGLLDEPLAQDVEASLRKAVELGVIFDSSPDPLAIYRQALRSSIRQLEEDAERFELFIRFLRDGPYEDVGPIPQEIALQRLTDDETGRAIRFIYHRVVSSFQGALAELLAIGPCASLVHDLQKGGHMLPDAQIYLGDASFLKAGNPERYAKGADIIVLSRTGSNHIRIGAIAEVKSYVLSQRRLEKQIGHQVRRAQRGILLRNAEGRYDNVPEDEMLPVTPVRIGVVPAAWRLPRTFRLEGTKGERGLFTDPPVPPSDTVRIVRSSPTSWRMTLRWSREALASAAYEMTFWLMGEIGRVLYAEERPLEWKDMSPAEAGRNAVKMMLYYAILRSRSAKEEGPAVALYNAYGFGYALGANFKDRKGRRQMLWFEDLDEILASGRTGRGYSFH